MLEGIIAIAVVVIGIAVYLWVFTRLRGQDSAGSLDEAISQAADEADSTSTQATKIFKAVDEVSNTQSSVGYDVDSSVTSTLSFVDTIGKDTVVVEIPDQKAKRTVSRGKAVAATAAVVRKATERKPDTAEELIVKLKRKIARRIDLLKLAGLPESSDKALAKYRSDLKKLTDTVKKGKTEAKAAVKEPKTAPKATAKAAPAKTATKAEPAKKPAKKQNKQKKAAKKPAKKTNK